MRILGWYRRRLLIASMVILALTIVLDPATSSPPRSVQANNIEAPPLNPPQLNGTVAVNPVRTEDTTKVVGTQLTVSIKLVNSSSINFFSVSVATWLTVLRPVSITPGDVFSNVPNSIVLPKTNCVNGQGLSCALKVDGPGVVTFSQALLGGETNNQTTSTLFQVTYNVTGVGATQIDILPTTLTLGAANTQLAVKRLDGSFSNKICGVALCKPPIASFFVARNSTLVQQRAILFNASASVPVNPSASIVSYDWVFGDGNGVVRTTPDVNYTYPGAGNPIVVLRVADSSNAIGIWSFSFRISRFFIDLVIGPDDLSIDHTTFVLQGTQIRIGLTVENVGTQAVNSTLAVLLSLGDRGNLTLSSKPIINLGTNSRTDMMANWDTTSYTPKVYRVIGRVDPVRNGTDIVENVTSNNDISAFVQIVTITPAGLSLSVVSGVSLLSLIVIGVVVSLARRFLNRKPELEADLS